MFLFKPYLYLDQNIAGDYDLYISVALHPGFRLGKPSVKLNRDTSTREITLPLIKQHHQVYYGPIELVINISQADKEGSGETGILVKVGNNNDPQPELQQKGKTKIVYLDQEVSTRGDGDRLDIDAWDKEP